MGIYANYCISFHHPFLQLSNTHNLYLPCITINVQFGEQNIVLLCWLISLMRLGVYVFVLMYCYVYVYYWERWTGECLQLKMFHITSTRWRFLHPPSHTQHMYMTSYTPQTTLNTCIWHPRDEDSYTPQTTRCLLDGIMLPSTDGSSIHS